MAFEEQLLAALNNLSDKIDNLSFDMPNRDNQDSPGYGGGGRPTSQAYNWNASGLSAGFGKILQNTSGDITVYSERLTAAIASVLSPIQSLGSALQVATNTLVELANASVMVSQNLRKFGLARQADLMDTFRLANSLNMTLADFERFVMQNNKSLIQFGGSVEGGIAELNKFQNLLRTDEEFEGMIGYLMSMGMTFKEINEYLTDYLSKNRALGLMEDEDRRKRLQEAIDFRTTLQGVSDATGLLVDELTKETESAASVAAKINYGATAPIAIAAANTMENLGLSPVSHVMLTGMLNPNDPKSKYVATMMPETYKLAMEINRLMKSGKDIDPDMVDRLITVAQREGAAMSATYGPLTAAAGLGDLGGLIVEGADLYTGADVGESIDKNQQLQAAYAAGEANTAMDSVLSTMADLSLATQNVGTASSNLIDNLQEGIVKAAEQLGNLVGGIAEGALSASSAMVVEFEDKTRQAIDQLDVEIAKLRQQGNDDQADLLEIERDKLQNMLEAIDLAEQHKLGNLSTEEFNAALANIGITLPENFLSDVNKVLDVALVKIGPDALDKFQGVFDPVPLKPDDPDKDEIEGQGLGPFLLDWMNQSGLGNVLPGLLNFLVPTADASTQDLYGPSGPYDTALNLSNELHGNFIQLYAAMEQAKASLGQPDPQLEQLLSLMNDSAQIELMKQQIETQQELRGDLKTIMSSIQSAADIIANATKWSAIHNSEVALTQTMPTRVNQAVGIVNRAK